uniref:hypothetical protein n=1 Tax=Alistipes sp. TaxID=1872444 RepID=UPI00405697AD
MDRIVVWSAAPWLIRESEEALAGVASEVVGVVRWGHLERLLRAEPVGLVLLFTPLKGEPLARLVRRLRGIQPRVELFALWWDESEQGAVERLMAGVNQIYTLPCPAERLRRGVVRALANGSIALLDQN